MPELIASRAQKLNQTLELHFPDGLIGCPDWQHFQYTPDAEAGEMVSLDISELSLWVVEARLLDPELVIDISEADLAALGDSNLSRLGLLIVITLENDPIQVSANLLGPLVVDLENGRARQIIQTDRRYQAQLPLLAPSLQVTFPQGLVGMPDWKRFAIQPDPGSEPVQTLVSIDDQELSLPIVPVRWVDPEFQAQLSPQDYEALELEADESPDFYAILSVESEPFQVYANLLGPLVINPQAGLGRQVILSQSGYSAATPVGAAPGSSEVLRADSDA